MALDFEEIKKRHTGKTNRKKGISFGKEVAIFLSEAFPFAEKQPNFYFDKKGHDIANTGKLKIQCKNFTKNYCSLKHFYEIEVKNNETKALFCKRDSDVTITLSIKDIADKKALKNLKTLLKKLGK